MLEHHLPFAWTRPLRAMRACLRWWTRDWTERRICRAARRGRNRVVAGMLDAGHWPADRVLTPRPRCQQNPWAGSHGGQTLLHLAALHGQLEVARALLERGARADAASHWGYTPAGVAAEQGDQAMVALLEQHGAKLERQIPSLLGTYWDGPGGLTVLEKVVRASGRAYCPGCYAQVRSAQLDDLFGGAPATATPERTRL